ncbi:MAG: NAD(P)H-hydrate dehydratase [Bacilli bacterium]|jgi:hydroxyethylthiazole kinase-like uncharacterized protein yjeF
MEKLQRLNLPDLPLRRDNTHKYDYGSLLIIGGSSSYLGAPILTGAAAFRLGTGLVTIALPEQLYQRYQPTYPSLIIRPFASLEALRTLLEQATAVVFGPGIDKDNSQNKDILLLLFESQLPLLIDASGLDILKMIKREDYHDRDFILTPHLGEARRLLDGKNPMEFYDELIYKRNVLILKGPVTIIGSQKHRFLADRGSSAMAKAGMGDVLSGIIGSLLAQGYSSLDAAKLGVYLHQSAAKFAVETRGDISLMSEDVIDSIPEAIKEIKKK